MPWKRSQQRAWSLGCIIGSLVLGRGVKKTRPGIALEFNPEVYLQDVAKRKDIRAIFHENIWIYGKY